MGKVGMSVLTKGLAMDFARQGRTEMAITSIWPAASIESAATEGAVKSDQEVQKDLRKPVSFPIGPGRIIINVMCRPSSQTPFSL